jgi:hypothetical protein
MREIEVAATPVQVTIVNISSSLFPVYTTLFTLVVDEVFAAPELRVYIAWCWGLREATRSC